MPASFASAADATSETSQQTVNQPSNSQATVTAKPDNFADYTKQKIETIKNKDIDLSEIARETMNPVEQTAVQQAGHLQGEASLTGEYNESYYPLDALNSGLPSLATPPNLSTPLATLEFFQSAIMKQQFDLAAYALNMNLIDSDVQLSRSLELSKRLDFY